MSVLTRLGLGVVVVAAATGLVGCSGDGQSSSITETEASISVVEQVPDAPTERGSLIEANDEDSSTENGDDDSLTDTSSTEVSDSEVGTDKPSGANPVSSSSLPASGPTSTQEPDSGSASAQPGQDNAAAESSSTSMAAGTGVGDDATASDSGSTSDEAGGSGNSNDVVDDDPGIDDSPPTGRANVAAPPGALFDLADGTSTELANEVGGLTLIWFWSTDTPTSEREAAVVQRFATTFDGSIGVVAVGSGGDRGEADGFVQTTDLGVTTLWSSNGDAAAHYQIEVLPTSLLVDGSGNIIGRWPGLPQEAFQLADRIT